MEFSSVQEPVKIENPCLIEMSAQLWMEGNPYYLRTHALVGNKNHWKVITNKTQ